MSRPADILGTMTDADAARVLGVTQRAACRMRRRLGIAPYRLRSDGAATRAAVLAALDDEWRSTADVAARAGVPPRTALGALETLRKAGSVRRSAAERPRLWRLA